MRRPGHNNNYYNCQKKRIYVKVHFVCNIKAGRTGEKNIFMYLRMGQGLFFALSDVIDAFVVPVKTQHICI